MKVLIKQKLTTKILFFLPFIIFNLIIFLSLLEPYLEYKGYAFSESIFRTLHYICHQAPSKSIWVGNYVIALCSRCFMVYLGLVTVGVIIFIRGYKNNKWFFGILIMIPMIVDGLTQVWGWRQSDNVTRIFTGLLGGIGIGLIFYPLYIKFIIYLRTKFDERR